MSLVFSIPGKTFIAGEYLALHGGPTLLLASEPRFELHVNPGQGRSSTIHPQSPAGKLITEQLHYFSQFDLEFVDPHQGRGGFGASTAQFLGVYALLMWGPSVFHEPQQFLDYRHLLETYYKVAWNSQGHRPSGADLIGQLQGSLTFFDKGQGQIAVKSWPFEDLEFFVVHTGNKVATHTHLQSLGDFPEQGLLNDFTHLRQAFDVADSELFVQAINGYAQTLRGLNFTCEPTLKLLSSVKALSGVLAVKGCGALGADVIFVVCQKGQSEALLNFLRQQNLAVTATVQDISAGLQMQVKQEFPIQQRESLATCNP